MDSMSFHSSICTLLASTSDCIIVIMMKRVYALSCSPSRFLNSSKWILGIMVAAFVTKYALCITFLVLAIGPESQITCESCLQTSCNHSLKACYLVVDPNIAGIYMCATLMSNMSGTLVISAQFPTLAFEILLFIFAFGYFVSDVWESWNSEGPKMWKSDFVQILIRDSTVYFAMYVSRQNMFDGSNTMFPVMSWRPPWTLETRPLSQ